VFLLIARRTNSCPALFGAIVSLILNQLRPESKFGQHQLAPGSRFDKALSGSRKKHSIDVATTEAIHHLYQIAHFTIPKVRDHAK
jgi:hypothetical protein